MSRAPIALFYGSSTCYTEMAAEKIQGAIGQHLGDGSVDLFNIVDEPIMTAGFYNHIIMGIPTWDYGELQEHWEDIWDEIDNVDFNQKTVALFGLGDQVGYPEWFLDAMGFLHSKMLLLKARPCGYWPNKGFDYEASKALTADEQHFVGLPLDEENQFDLTQERIDAWVPQVLAEFGLI